MTKGIKLVILFLVSMIGIIVLVYFFFFWRNKKQIPPTSLEKENQGQLLDISSERLIRGGNTTSQEEGIVADSEKNLLQKNSQTQNNFSQELSSLAFLFVERFGSFSNESHFQNWRDLEILMTDSMKNWVEKQISKNIGKNQESTQNRTTTKALSVKSFDLDNNKNVALFLITTQRKEVVSAKENVYYQDIEIQFLKEGVNWKVDSVFWK